MSLSTEEILRRGIKDLNAFADGDTYISSGNDFVAIQTTVLKELVTLGQVRNTKYYKGLLSDYPIFTAFEIDEYIKDIEGRFSSENLIGGLYFALLAKLYRSIKGNKNTDKKLSQMKQINTSVLNAVNLPGIEQMIEESGAEDQ